MGYASLWKRGAAVIIDGLIVAVLFYLVLLTNVFENPALYSVYFYFAYLVPFIYFIAMEEKYGQTLGKKLLMIKVIDKSGKKASFRSCLLRNVLRIVDMLPAFYIIGIISILLTGKRQRVGDLAADTVVVDSNK